MDNTSFIEPLKGLFLRYEKLDCSMKNTLSILEQEIKSKFTNPKQSEKNDMVRIFKMDLEFTKILDHYSKGRKLGALILGSLKQKQSEVKHAIL